MTDSRECYNYVYLHEPSYDRPIPKKWPTIERWLESRQPKRVLDVGCGAGHTLKRLLSLGLNVTGLEVSDVCCQRHLQDVPHINAEFAAFADSTDQRFDCIYCYDVLEHLEKSELDGFLTGCAKLAPWCLFGIANHSSVHCGRQLHLLRHPHPWWTLELLDVFAEVRLVEIASQFFVLEAQA